MLQFLDHLLFAIHIVIIAFNLFGWIFQRTRKAHLIVVGITLFSWLVLGIWKGLGYCILTDWHWDVKSELGELAIPGSFIQYLSNNVFGLDWSRTFVDGLTLTCFVIAIVSALAVRFYKPKGTV